MERITVSLDTDLVREFDELIRERGYANRSEAMRDLLREQLRARTRRGTSTGACIATLSFVYSHHERELGERLTAMQHEHHDLVVSGMHAHLDHEQCLETLILKGPLAAVRQFGEALMAERGVRHGQLNLVPVQESAAHEHGGVRHRHLRPKH
jgi:CopG family nickel-responsive transcriptional regulator